MAAPANVGIHNMDGTWVMNKTASDPTDAMLKMQGVGFIMRQAISFATVSVTLKQYVDADGVEHLDNHTVSSGGISNDENRTLDWKWTEVDDKVWGKVKTRARICKFTELENPEPFLTEGWLPETLEGDAFEIQVEHLKGGWTAHQVWGFASIDGERRRIQKVVTGKKGQAPITARVLYDWKE